MGMVVNHNISAINTLRNLNGSNRMMSKSLQKLSSGFRINTGADGPADLIISEQLRAQTVGLQRAVRNTQEATNVIGIAEGALNEMNSILKSMRELALHAANSGITSPEQVAADQAEVDSSIQTIDRIANTTKYSDQFLLNGNKSLLYDTNSIKGNSIIDTSFTRIDQVFKLSGVTESFTYTGLTEAADASNMINQASKGFMESGATDGSRADLNLGENQLATAQRFMVSGRKGSREFSFDSGTELSAIASSINNVSGSTGVAAELVVANEGFTVRAANVTGIDYAEDAPEAADIFSANQSIVFGQADISTEGVTAVTWYDDPVLGKNTDGAGRIYVEYTGTSTLTVNLYKGPKQSDGTFNADDLVASGSITNAAAALSVTVAERNDSGLSGLITVLNDSAVLPPADTDVVIATHTMDYTNTATGRNATLTLSGGSASSGITITAPANQGSDGNKISVELVDPGAKSQALSASVDGNKITVSLATDANGNISATASTATLVAAAINGLTTDVGAVTAAALGGGGGTVEARSENFLSGGLDQNQAFNIDGSDDGFDSVAISGLELGVNTDADGKLYFEVSDDDAANSVDTIKVYKDAAKNAESLVAAYVSATDLADGYYVLNERNDSGLRGIVQVDISDLPAGDTTFTARTGIRLSATDYGSEGFVKIQAYEGKMWDYHDTTSSNADADFGYVNLDSSSGAIVAESRGSGATVSVNGRSITASGLTAEASTADFSGKLVFKQGTVGETTVAQVGYASKLASASIGQMMLAQNLHLNAGVNNREDMSNFSGGMQFQLGEGSGDQERTVYSIQSMAVSNLGRVSFTDDFDGNGTNEAKELSLQDILGGGFASLAADPIKALDIIDQAINDVSGLRARLGATQKNLLQTNANSLNVAIENITATESSIRDADMAAETTDFTKNQILVQAGTAMLAQANVVSQNVLQLLG